MIIIEDSRYQHDIAKQHADYTKLDNYNNLLEAYKDKFCIPLSVGYMVTSDNNDVLNYYNIDADRPLITYNDHLEIKQQMKEKGARFRINYSEFKEIIDYYLIRNNIKFINEDSAILKDSINFGDSLKNTVVGLCDDFKLYNNRILNYDKVKNKGIEGSSFIKSDYTIYDETSELVLSNFFDSFHSMVFYMNYVNNSIIDKTFVATPDLQSTPSFYMYKKITNNKIYDVANYIVNESSYFYVAGDPPYYSPVFNGEKTRKAFDVDENWEYNGIHKIKAEKGGEIDKKTYALYNEVYNMLARSKEKSNLLASYYFANREYDDVIFDFVTDIIIDLSNKDYDYKNEENNKMIDNKIDEFITNFNIHYK